MRDASYCKCDDAGDVEYYIKDNQDVAGPPEYPVDAVWREDAYPF